MDSNVLDLVIVNRLAERFSKVTGVYGYAISQDGKIISSITGNETESNRLMDLVGRGRLDALYHRVSDSELEEQALEETLIPNIQIGAMCLHTDHLPIITWVLICVLEDEELANAPGAIDISGFSYTSTLDQFSKTLDIVRDITQLIVCSKLSLVSAEAESRRSKSSEESAKAALKRVEVISEIVALLDSDDAIENVMHDIIELCGSFLKISRAMIIRTRKETQNMEIVCDYCSAGVGRIYETINDAPKFSFFDEDKFYSISAGTPVNSQIANDMAAVDATAIVVKPIHIVNGYGMYAFFADNTPKRKWSVDEIKFLNDAGQILVSIITRRIQKNSLASSYATLESILDNVGSSIYVRDLNTNKVLFANRVLKSTFAAEMQNGTLDALFDSAIPINKASGIYEVHNIDRRQWYDLHYTYVNWVDGRKVSVCAAYDVTDKKTYQRRIEQQAYTDFLTGLYNRMCCERDLAMHIDTAKNNKTNGALLYLDLDDFKHINDGLGHQYGDVLLKAISHSLQRIDGITNTCYRMGGDEFVIIVPPESFKGFEKIVEDIKDIFSKPWYLKDADYYCTMSMGIVEFPESGENVQDLIKKADIAMYEAKKTGKNRVARYSDKIETSSNRRLDMEKNMRDAITDKFKEFEVYYQPIIDVQTEGNPCLGAEALIRWNSSELGFIAPGDFIPLAEYLGLINPIGNNVLLEACRELKYWNENGHPDFKVNVNLSVVQLLQTDIVEIVEKTIKETGINPENLTLEVTESLAINDMERMKKILGSIKTFGVKIALDDFGTGYSSLNHIREIPFDVIKVDQSFVRDLAADAYSQSFVKMVSELAETIGVSVCVEGIETKEQFGVLSGMRVRMVQGYYFDRPMTRESFEAKYVIQEG